MQNRIQRQTVDSLLTRFFLQRKAIGFLLRASTTDEIPTEELDFILGIVGKYALFLPRTKHRHDLGEEEEEERLQDALWRFLIAAASDLHRDGISTKALFYVQKAFASPDTWLRLLGVFQCVLADILPPKKVVEPPRKIYSSIKLPSISSLKLSKKEEPSIQRVVIVAPDVACSLLTFGVLKSTVQQIVEHVHNQHEEKKRIQRPLTSLAEPVKMKSESRKGAFALDMDAFLLYGKERTRPSVVHFRR